MTKTFDERNAEKSRAVCEAMAEAADRGRCTLTEKEQRILDMWPKYEDGEYVWFGDEINADPIFGGGADVARAIEFMSFTYILKNAGNEPIVQDGFDARVKRSARSVLDADGVEIKVGDTVWSPSGSELEVTGIDTSTGYSVMTRNKLDVLQPFEPKSLSHTRPDSWRRLEEDAQKDACDYFGVECDSEAGCRMCPHFQDDRDCSLDMNADIVRRAKALAGIEVD